MVASRRVQSAKSDRYHQNVHKRGKVSSELEKLKNKGKGLAVGPVLLGFFLFVVVGSAYTALLTAYLTLNSLLNLTNKWALSWFSFPLLLTACHMAFSFIFLLPLMLSEPIKSKHVDTLKRQWKGFVFVGIFLGLNISLNNTALTAMTLSLNQVIRASIPVFTCLLSMLFERKFPSKSEAVSLVVLTLGVMTAMWRNKMGGASWAIGLCLMGTVSNAGMMSLSGKVLSEKVDVLQLTFYTAPVSFIAILPAFIFRELSEFLIFRSENSRASWAIILGTSAVALSYNIVHSLMIQQTSAVTTTVIGQAKILGLLVLSATVLGEKKTFTKSMTIGTIISLFGFFLYSHAKLQTKKQKPPPEKEILPTSSAELEPLHRRTHSRPGSPRQE